MTLQQMEYIVAVDKYRHFVHAAESCHVTQSTLSSMIQKLESELDITIFDRNSHPIRPTEMGEEIITQAKVVLFNASQIQELVQSKKDEAVGSVRLGVTSTIAPYILPKLFKFISSDYPQVRLFAEEARVPAIIKKIERAELDMALLATPLNNNNLLEIPLYHEKFVAYVSTDDQLFEQENITADQLPAEKLWVLQEAYCPNNGIFSFCKTRGGNATIYEAGSIETLVKIVDENGGCTIIPELHIPLLRKCQQTQIRPIVNPEPSREISLVIRTDFVRERMLNIIADSIKKIIPNSMLLEKVKKYKIKL